MVERICLQSFWLCSQGLNKVFRGYVQAINVAVERDSRIIENNGPGLYFCASPCAVFVCFTTFCFTLECLYRHCTTHAFQNDITISFNCLKRQQMHTSGPELMNDILCIHLYSILHVHTVQKLVLVSILFQVLELAALADSLRIQWS